ncbi:hypothetical protein PF005_g12061 [Phytophthora fragariae]|uniref:Uncharacterized protein n=1 Tax=Phytophthora fragariae TaxID=53985 RepID=A0A6A3JYX0_9STRA|nr:hypothetical protein PF003_g6025 [Phytophthora fragariae]KAE8933069.1 hypothetical protein PF009_g16916 [Phytophthora fragariae]KAE8998508.1 hypothetical protein PF011_g15023 [Phytophthora fragariae]KAE9098637.1 hypothetical protein PF007_g16188 [Phytophthora fragariae]KAE9134873.1 hypothetical protein PF006_g14729 [Phytophthora fragariae]
MDETVDSLSEKDNTNLKTALESNSTCGFDMKRLLDHLGDSWVQSTQSCVD